MFNLAYLNDAPYFIVIGDWLCAFIASLKFSHQSKFLDYYNRNVDGIETYKIFKNNVQYMVVFLQTLRSQWVVGSWIAKDLGRELRGGRS